MGVGPPAKQNRVSNYIRGGFTNESESEDRNTFNTRDQIGSVMDQKGLY